MKNTLQFRHATLEDLPKIIDIYNSTIASRMVTADTEPVTIDSRLSWFHEHGAKHRPLYVITEQDQIAGWISFQSFYGRPAYNGTAEISIYIDQSFRGKGIGRIAMEKAILECPELGIHTVLGFIFGHNVPSLALFEKFGFEKWGTLPKVAVLDQIERDLIIVGKRITREDSQ
jgi:L-amino acid N-acyltransferase YncA